MILLMFTDRLRYLFPATSDQGAATSLRPKCWSPAERHSGIRSPGNEGVHMGKLEISWEKNIGKPKENKRTWRNTIGTKKKC